MQAYNDILGQWQLDNGFCLLVDKIQADPYAAPSRFRARIPLALAGFPLEATTAPPVLTAQPVTGSEQQQQHCSQPQAAKQPAGAANLLRRVALCDFLSRRFCRLLASQGLTEANQGQGWGGKKGGDIQMERPSQHVLSRTSVVFLPADNTFGGGGGTGSAFLEARFTVSLPARGRSVLGHQARQVLCAGLPPLLGAALQYKSFSGDEQSQLQRHILTVEDQV